MVFNGHRSDRRVLARNYLGGAYISDVDRSTNPRGNACPPLDRFHCSLSRNSSADNSAGHGECEHGECRPGNIQTISKIGYCAVRIRFTRHNE